MISISVENNSTTSQARVPHNHLAVVHAQRRPPGNQHKSSAAAEHADDRQPDWTGFVSEPPVQEDSPYLANRFV